MKKIILLLALSVTFFSTAQSTYLIQNPLRLETVKAGSKSDSVLVRGADKIVKFVPRTEFLSTIPNLDQVLGRGQNAMDHTIYLMSSGDHYAAYGPFGYTIFNQSENSRLDFSDYEISKKNGNYEFHLSFNRDPLNTTYNNFIFPQKSSGTYTSDIITYSPVSDSIAGIVDNTALQELGGVDKLINGIRIGKGGGNISSNLVLGSDSLLSNSTGNYSTAIGYKSLYTNTIGAYNTSVGSLSLNYNTTGLVNTSVGAYASQANTTGSYNTVVGGSALSANQFGSSNVAIGASALRNNVGVSGSNIYGHRSIAIGGNAMLNNTTGNGIAIGDTSLKSQTTGTYNIAVGFQAGSGITTGNTNVIIADTGFVTAGGGITTGSNNMIIAPNNGNTTGITTGSGNIVLGKVTGLSASASNTITISDGVGNIAITKSTIGELKTPNLTQALIISGGTSSLVNKGYVDNTTAVDNATTTTLSSATLTSTYPNALSGFRVRCLNIASGALTYEKTTAGWIQYTITITQ